MINNLAQATSTKCLEALGVPHSVAYNYATSNPVVYSTPTGISNMTPYIADNLKRLQKMFASDYEIYHVLITFSIDYCLVDYLLCPLDKIEADYLLNDAKDGYLLSYCLNMTIPEFSEAGTIRVKYNSLTNSLLRIG